MGISWAKAYNSRIMGLIHNYTIEDLYGRQFSRPESNRIYTYQLDGKKGNLIYIMNNTGKVLKSVNSVSYALKCLNKGEWIFVDTKANNIYELWN